MSIVEDVVVNQLLKSIRGIQNSYGPTSEINKKILITYCYPYKTAAKTSKRSYQTRYRKDRMYGYV